MRYLVLFSLIFLLGDCVEITKGVFKGSQWTVIQVNEDGSYDLRDDKDILREVRGSYLISCTEK